MSARTRQKRLRLSFRVWFEEGQVWALTVPKDLAFTKPPTVPKSVRITAVRLANRMTRAEANAEGRKRLGAK